jgi:hypothetical protein
MSDRGHRVGVNEALFREVNDRIDELQGDLGRLSTFEIVCECGNSECLERFTISAGDYADVRRDVHNFAVVPGHEAPDIELVVVRRERYFVVRKTDPDAAKAAEEMA